MKSSFNEKRVLVTGASGFIGSHLVERLATSGYIVKALVHYNSEGRIGNLDYLSKDVLESVEIIMGDIRDKELIFRELKDIDIVFHLAALIGIPYSYRAPSSYLDTNTIGTYNIAAGAIENDIMRVVHTSTSEVYGTAEYTPMDEQHRLKAQSPYSASKIAADKIMESYYCSYKLPVTTIRPFNTYGPRQSKRAVVPTLCSQFIHRPEKIMIGSLDPRRDMTYVDDTITALVKAADSDNRCLGEVINLGTGTSYSIREIYDMLCSLTQCLPVVEEDAARKRPTASEVMVLLSDNSKAAQLLDWSPEVSLREGLSKVLDFWRERAEVIDRKYRD